MTTDRLAALLHEATTRIGWASCVHSSENEWLPFCEVAAARLAQRGVTVAPQPDEDQRRREAISDDRAWQSGYAAGRSAAMRTQPAPDLLKAARMVLRWHDETSALGMAEPLVIAALRAAVEGATA